MEMFHCSVYFLLFFFYLNISYVFYILFFPLFCFFLTQLSAPFNYVFHPTILYIFPAASQFYFLLLLLLYFLQFFFLSVASKKHKLSLFFWVRCCISICVGKFYSISTEYKKYFQLLLHVHFSWCLHNTEYIFFSRSLTFHRCGSFFWGSWTVQKK